MLCIDASNRSAIRSLGQANRNTQDQQISEVCRACGVRRAIVRGSIASTPGGPGTESAIVWPTVRTAAIDALALLGGDPSDAVSRQYPMGRRSANRGHGRNRVDPAHGQALGRASNPSRDAQPHDHLLDVTQPPVAVVAFQLLGGN
jgi:hypothetical protein